MAYLVQNYHGDAECVFTSCGHAPAVVEYVHEFVNRPSKFLCEEHMNKIRPKYTDFIKL